MMFKGFKKWFLILGVLVLIIFIGIWIRKPKESTNTTQPTLILKGITLTPKSFDSQDFTDFFDNAKEAGKIISWAGDWNELKNTSGGGPRVTAELASVNDYIPLIEAQFFTQSTGKLLRPQEESIVEEYKTSAVEFAKKYKPKYLAFGIEVNILYEKSPADFEAFVPVFAEVYDALKAVSSETKIFTIFQLEKMKGLSGGLFGGTNDLSKNQWDLLDKFSKSDIIAFTTYPSLVYKKPSEIKANYYSEIKKHTQKPVAFTEIGWHSAAGPSGWESNESEQAEFVDKFFKLTKELNPEMAIWSFMYDQKTIEPFNSMGLFTGDGKEKSAWEEWKSK